MSPFFKYLLLGLTLTCLSTSCVPLAIGAAGVAGGYMIRESGVGVVEPAGSEDTYEY